MHTLTLHASWEKRGGHRGGGISALELDSRLFHHLALSMWASDSISVPLLRKTKS